MRDFGMRDRIQAELTLSLIMGLVANAVLATDMQE